MSSSGFRMENIQVPGGTALFNFINGELVQPQIEPPVSAEETKDADKDNEESPTPPSISAPDSCSSPTHATSSSGSASPPQFDQAAAVEACTSVEDTPAEDEGDQCAVCLDMARVVAMSCGHRHCAGCTLRIIETGGEIRCPQCQCKFTSVIRLF
jgi:hypothetical protein